MEETQSSDIKAIMDSEGVSRSTAYRRAGKPGAKKPKAKPVVNEPAIVAEPTNTSDGGVAWARAILWAAENMRNKRITKRGAGSIANYSMWQFSQEEPKTLLVQLVPRALTIIDKYKGEIGGSDADAAEQADIADLEDLLARAIVDAGIG